jgi:glyoxylase-like metal-dependent hydrolase (beta-lactamase superfamily II)
MRLRFLLAAAAATMALTAGTPSLAKPLEYEVIPTGPVSMFANVTLIKGDKGAVLVDVPFARSDAYRVAAAVLDSGRHLDTIVITHDHPDHFFGLDVLADAFPDAKIVANPVAAKDMARSIPIKFKRWSGQLGINAPHRPVQPTAMTGDTIDLEGHKLEVLGPMQGDHVHSTVVWDPESRTLVAGDVLYNQVHVWLGEHTPERYTAWLAVLDRLDALKPVTVVAGHRHPGTPDDNGSIDWTRRYIKTFVAARANSHSAAELSAAMMKAYPDATEVYGGFLLGTSSKVGAGEIPPWDE